MLLRRLEATEMWFNRQRIPSTEHVSNKEVLREMKTKRKQLLRIRKRQFYYSVMRKEDLENLALTRPTESKRSRGKVQVNSEIV